MFNYIIIRLEVFPSPQDKKKSEKNPEDIPYYHLKKNQELSAVIKQMKEDWIFFIDNGTLLKSNLHAWFMKLQEKYRTPFRVIADKNNWLPLLVRRDWLLKIITSEYYITSLPDFNRLLRNQDTLIIDKAWPVNVRVRPSIKEKFQAAIIEKWWESYDSKDCILKQDEISTIRRTGYEILWGDFREKIYQYYDIVIIKDFEKHYNKKLLSELISYGSIFSWNQNDLYLSSEFLNKNRYRQHDACIEHMIWLMKVKEEIFSGKFILCHVKSNEINVTYYIFEYYKQIITQNINLKKQNKSLGILIDMPGIGDAVRLIGLLAEIRNKYLDYEIVLIVNINSSLIYRQANYADEIFICTLRPDPPTIPFIAYDQLSDFLLTRHFENVISWAWDTSAYMSNEKLNFVDVYGNIANSKFTTGNYLKTNASADIRVKKLLTATGINFNKKIIALQFGASMESKSWSICNRIQFVDRLLQTFSNIQIINFDYDKIGHENVVNIGGKTNILEFVSAINLCDIFIGVDSSGGHIAAALSKPSITIYGKEKPRLGNDHRPISDKNIGLIPNEDCECPEYQIHCMKTQKCIDSVTVDYVLYGLLKGIEIQYFSQIIMDVSRIDQKIWWIEGMSQGASFQYVKEVNSLSLEETYRQGVKLNVTGLKGDNDLFYFIFDRSVIASDLTSQMGIDLWIDKDVFKNTSYALMQCEVIHEGGSKFNSDWYRLHEGWNLLHYKLNDIHRKMESIIYRIRSKKDLQGYLYVHKFYTISLK